MRRFKPFNADMKIENVIKPFNIALVDIKNEMSNGDPVKPIILYNKKPQSVVLEDFINYENGLTMNGPKYWKKMNHIFWDYIDHP
jgi:hypothetical protein